MDITDRTEGESSGNMDLLIRKRMSDPFGGSVKSFSGPWSPSHP